MKIETAVARVAVGVGAAASLATGLMMATGKVGQYAEVGGGVTLAVISMLVGLVVLAQTLHDE